MKIISKEEVKKEMGVIPGVLLYDFYIKEVIGDEICYHPIKTPETLNVSCKRN